MAHLEKDPSSAAHRIASIPNGRTPSTAEREAFKRQLEASLNQLTSRGMNRLPSTWAPEASRVRSSPNGRTPSAAEREAFKRKLQASLNQRRLKTSPETEWKITETSKLSKNDLVAIFDIYVKTYETAGQELWFKKPEDLKRYHCMAVVGYKGPQIFSFLMYQKRKYGNKLSLLGHDGTREWKNLVIAKIVSLVNTPGWFLECSDAISWALRKQGLAPITNKATIEKILEIDNVTQTITMNPHYKIDDKTQQVYVHNFVEEGFHNSESLFGRVCNTWDNADNCGRHCINGGYKTTVR